MTTFNACFGQNSKVVLAILAPVAVFVPIFLVLVTLPGQLPDWIIMPASFLLMLVCILSTLKLVSMIRPHVEVTLENEDIRVTFKERGFLVPGSFSFTLADVENLWADEDKGFSFLYVRLNRRPGSFHLMSVSAEEAAVQEFSSLQQRLLERAEQRRLDPSKPLIRHETMYERPWARVLAAASLAAMTVVPPYNLTHGPEDQIPWSRYLLLCLFGVGFIAKVVIHNRSDRQ